MKVLASPAFANKHINPYNQLLYTELHKEGVEVVESWSLINLITSDIWHIHWPENFLTSKTVFDLWLRFIMFLIKVIIIKLFHLKIIWTVHNLSPHECKSNRLKKFFYKNFSKVCDGLIFLSKTSLNKSNESYINISKSKVKVIYHGHYKDILNIKISKVLSREHLKISKTKFIYLFFGHVRLYKNVVGLIHEFNNLKTNDSLLCIIGNIENNILLASEIEDLTMKNENIIMKNKFIDELELQKWLSASDLVVLPYKAITNSGSVLYALSNEKPVLAPNLGSLKEIQTLVGNNHLILYDGDFKCDYFKGAREKITNQSQKEIDLSKFNWNAIATQTHDFYKEVLIKQE